MTDIEKAAIVNAAQNESMNYARSVPLDAAEHFEVGFLAGARYRDAELTHLRSIAESARQLCAVLEEHDLRALYPIGQFQDALKEKLKGGNPYYTPSGKIPEPTHQEKRDG